MLDVDRLLQPVSEEAPCGEDLEYDADFLRLEELLRGKPERQVGDSVIPAEPPEWPAVLPLAESLLDRTKDLRVAVACLRAATVLHGFEGMQAGLSLVCGLLENHWDAVYPRLDPDDDNDPTMRLNALAPISDETGLRLDMAPHVLGRSRNYGTARVREALAALEILTPSETDQVLTTSQVESLLQECFAESGERGNLPAALVETVQRIESTVRTALDSYAAISLAPLLEWLEPLAGLYTRVLSSFEPQAGDAAASASGDEAGAASPLTGEVLSREQALRALDKVCAYLERAEPTNPAPLLIRRAQRLMTMSFLEIMRDLAPDALAPVHMVAGVREGEGDSN